MRRILQGAVCGAALLCAISSAEPLLAEFDSGLASPVPVSYDYPFSTLHLHRPPRALAQPGRREGGLTVSWANSAKRQQEWYTVDFESVTAVLSATALSSTDYALGFRVPVVHRGGGVLDSGIDGWHRALRLPRGDRPKLIDDSLEISAQGVDDRSLSRSGAGVGVSEIWAQLPLGNGAGVEFSVGLPAERPAFGQQQLDLGAAFLWGADWERVALDCGAGAIFSSDTTVAGFEFAPWRAEAFAAASYAYLERVALRAALAFETVSVQGVPRHPDLALYLDIGVGVTLPRGFVLDIVMRENPYDGDGSVDVALIAALRWFER